MSFVSFAQNAEDVMLWRALGGVREGFYVDVGAQDPELDSVTRAFYDRGWRGVNVEPVLEYAAALTAARPRDTTLQVAIAAAAGERTLFRIPGTGLSTLEPEVAALQEARGWRVDRITTTVTTLAALCREHAPAEIHFLKIDVEGGERAVLLGADFRAHRPWIVLVEATLPNSQTENWAEWEPILLAAEYRFVWFDGLNRFYVAAERHAALADHFRAPPNVYDGFRRDDPEARRYQRALLADLDTLRAWQADALRQSATLREAVARSRDPRPDDLPQAGEGRGEKVERRSLLRRLLRPLALHARAFMSAETRSTFADLAVHIEQQGQILRDIQRTQGVLLDAVARRPELSTADELAALARAAEAALLTLAATTAQAEPQVRPSASHRRSA